MGLQLHGGKVILLCLRSDLHSEWRLRFASACPETRDAVVTHTAKHLGYYKWLMRMPFSHKQLSARLRQGPRL
eukprot:3166862-Amphidinium_carterae.2